MFVAGGEPEGVLMFSAGGIVSLFVLAHSLVQNRTIPPGGIWASYQTRPAGVKASPVASL